MAADLPDLFLLSLFRRLGANDRLSAGQVCLNWYHRVREVNQNIKYLTLTIGCRSIENESFNKTIDHYAYGYNPLIKQQLIKDKADQENLEPSTSSNTLQFSCFTTDRFQLNSKTVEQIIAIFPFTTELNFITSCIDDLTPYYEALAQMLESDQNNQNNGWKKQLITLRIISIHIKFKKSVSDQTSQRLFVAINNLPSLNRLALDVDLNNCLNVSGTLHHLPVLSRLKEISFRHNDDRHLVSFLHSVQLYAAKNTDLKIDLPDAFSALERLLKTPYLAHTYAPLFYHQVRERIVRVNIDPILNLQHNIKSVCSSFANLTSLTVHCTPTDNYGPLFDLISRRLHHLRHLKLHFAYLEIWRNRHRRAAAQENIYPLPTSPLPSVKFLELSMTHTSHSDVRLFNLPVTMPNLQAIHFSYYYCIKCKIDSSTYDNHDGTTNWAQLLERVAGQQCFSEVLQKLQLATSLPLEQITVDLKSSSVHSAKQLLPLKLPFWLTKV